MAKLPMQPIIWAKDGVIRFRENRLVSRFMDAASNGHRYDLNAAAIDACHGAYTREEQMQFAQLIGYSVSGFGELSYATPSAVAFADETAERMGRHPRAKEHKRRAMKKSS